MTQNFYLSRPAKKQQGAALILALTFLLIITIVTIANMREVSLESRITANTVESKRLINIAESAVRNGERSLQLVDSDGEIFFSPPTLRSNCNGLLDTQPCVLDIDPDYKINTSVTRNYATPNTSLEGTAQYYVLASPAGTTRGENENPEYGNMLMGIGIFRYEVNGIAERNSMQTALRTTVALHGEGKFDEE